ncbi:MAG: hypothetical protein S4CHLAM123_07840 [Chlamydiales bacterium]|nr:hypothetical protein [Chlamydiales bacterium]
MKKRDLSTLALVGISAGLMMGGCNQKETDKKGDDTGNKAHAAEQLSPDMKSFHDSLSPTAQKKFMELDAQHKMMAIEMANQSCNGRNKCASMGGCSSANNSCAGENGCKGQGGAPVKDPNKAVDVQYKMQKDQRKDANGKMQ